MKTKAEEEKMKTKAEEEKLNTEAEEEKRARHKDSTVNTADYCYHSDNVDSSSIFRPLDTCDQAQPV